jgi:hypothetical protein
VTLDSTSVKSLNHRRHEQSDAVSLGSQRRAMTNGVLSEITDSHTNCFLQCQPSQKGICVGGSLADADVRGLADGGDGAVNIHSKSFLGNDLHVPALQNDEMSSLRGSLTEVGLMQCTVWKALSFYYCVCFDAACNPKTLALVCNLEKGNVSERIGQKGQC